MKVLLHCSGAALVGKYSWQAPFAVETGVRRSGYARGNGTAGVAIPAAVVVAALLRE
jgi:hypothetical protein